MNSDLPTDSLQGSLSAALRAMESAQLVRRVEEEDAAFLFKHTLVQDTVYASMMRHERKRLHLLVGETLEQAYPERLDELAPRLAAHFDEAGETARALYYFERAAQIASARYANREALEFYTRALDAAEELHATTRDSLYRARGVVQERTGNFDAARADLENAVRIARQEGDAATEWQGWIDLGFAWLERDYARAGEAFERALDLARESNDRARVAHTLNRVGNWYVNIDEPQRAASYHQEALEIFEALKDPRGIAETQDLLSMMHSLGGDYIEGDRHARAALELFQSFDDPLAILNARIASALTNSLLQGDTLVASPAWRERNLEARLANVLPEARQVGWRAGEAFALLIFGEAFAVDGKYGRALELQERGMMLAREIKHRQWLVGTMLLYGRIHALILNFENARAYMENALTLARDLGSQHWARTGNGFLASTLIEQNELALADSLLKEAFASNPPAQSVGQRQIWCARAELALARNDPDLALDVVDHVLRATQSLSDDAVIPRLWLLRARAHLRKNTTDLSESLARTALTSAQATNQPAWEWRSAALLGQIYRAQHRTEDAQRAANAAQAVVHQLADTLNDSTLRENFLQRANASILA